MDKRIELLPPQLNARKIWLDGLFTMDTLLSPSQQKEIISELESLAQLLGMDVVESIKFPTIMVRVSLGGSFTAITKKGSDFWRQTPCPACR